MAGAAVVGAGRRGDALPREQGGADTQCIHRRRSCSAQHRRRTRGPRRALLSLGRIRIGRGSKWREEVIALPLLGQIHIGLSGDGGNGSKSVKETRFFFLSLYICHT